MTLGTQDKVGPLCEPCAERPREGCPEHDGYHHVIDVRLGIEYIVADDWQPPREPTVLWRGLLDWWEPPA